MKLEKGDRKAKLFPDELRSAAEEALDFACDEDWSNMAITGNKGKQTFEDFNVLMEKGGSLTVESMGTQVGEQIKENCNKLVDELGKEIVKHLTNTAGKNN